METLKQGYVNRLIDKQLAESFSIGMTMLQAGTLRDLDIVYDVSKFNFNENILDRRIN